MMWRWNKSYTAEDVHVTREHLGCGLMEARELCINSFTDMTTGYCGLAR
jgi:hypothetical protein